MIASLSASHTNRGTKYFSNTHNEWFQLEQTKIHSVANELNLGYRVSIELGETWLKAPCCETDSLNNSAGFTSSDKTWLIYSFTVPKFAISQSEAKSNVLISYDIKSQTWYPAISWSLSGKVMLPFDKLQRGFANKQITRNLIFCGGKKAQKHFPPKLNW